MILKPEVHNPNDVTIKYMVDVIPKEIHHRLGLSGIFVKNYPTRIIKMAAANGNGLADAC